MPITLAVWLFLVLFFVTFTIYIVHLFIRKNRGILMLLIFCLIGLAVFASYIYGRTEGTNEAVLVFGLNFHPQWLFAGTYLYSMLAVIKIIDLGFLPRQSRYNLEVDVR